MTFKDTYADAVLESRRIRSQRAGFWAKVVGLLLVLTIGATLRSEPQLRLALMSAGMDAVMAMTGRAPPEPQPTQPAVPDLSALRSLLPNAQQQTTPVDDTPPDSGIKINRPGASTPGGARFERVTPETASAPAPPAQSTPNAMATQLGQLLKQMNLGE